MLLDRIELSPACLVQKPTMPLALAFFNQPSVIRFIGYLVIRIL